MMTLGRTDSKHGEGERCLCESVSHFLLRMELYAPNHYDLLDTTGMYPAVIPLPSPTLRPRSSPCLSGLSGARSLSASPSGDRSCAATCCAASALVDGFVWACWVVLSASHIKFQSDQRLYFLGMP